MQNKRKALNAGFTLVEVIVSLLIVVIIISAAGGIFLAGGKLFHQFTEYGEEQQIVENMAGIIREQLEYAQNLEVSYDRNAKIASNEVIKFDQDGYIYRNGEGMYPEEYYNGWHVKSTIQQQPEHKQVLNLTLTLLDQDNKQLVSRYIVVKLKNMELKSREITYTSEGLAAVPAEVFTGGDGKSVYLYYLK